MQKFYYISRHSQISRNKRKRCTFFKNRNHLPKYELILLLLLLLSKNACKNNLQFINLLIALLIGKLLCKSDTFQVPNLRLYEIYLYIRYCKPVSCIRWGAISDSCPRAVVKCCDGEEFPADYVIVTVSLGVLKHQHDKLFCPALPAEKVEAICKLGYGYVNKIFLEYARPFWVWKEGGIKLAWSADELADRCDWVKGTLSLFFNVPLTSCLET